MVQEDRSLKGRTIVITRPRDQAQETVRAIVERGGKPYLFPTIEIQAPKDLAAVKRFFKALACKEADYVIFMSVNGVQHLLAIALNLGILDEVKANLKCTVVMAVGPRTAQELEENGIHVDMVPEKYTSEGILLCLQQSHAKDKAIYIPRTSEAPPELGQKLREMGNCVEEIHVYQSQLPNDEGLVAEFASDLEAEKLDAILFTSSLGVKNFIQMLKHTISGEKLKALIARTVIVAIGPTTAKTLAEEAMRVDVIPREHTLNAALTALVSYWEHKTS
jgi:uroporphyrinogen III methyltransferase/synthase